MKRKSKTASRRAQWRKFSEEFRAKAVCRALESLSAKLEDNQVTPDELEAAVTEIQELVAGWK